MIIIGDHFIVRSGVTMPEEYGGLGLDCLFAAVHWEEQAYSCSSGPGWALHSEIVMPYILHYGSGTVGRVLLVYYLIYNVQLIIIKFLPVCLVEELKSKYLPQMCRGSVIGAIAMTEPGAGSDLQGIQTCALKQPDGDYIINGSKTFITNGQLSDVVIVVAKTR